MSTKSADYMNNDALRADFEKTYFLCKIVIDDFLPESQLVNMTEQSFLTSMRANLGSAVPLEKLTIAKFKGDPKDTRDSEIRLKL